MNLVNEQDSFFLAFQLFHDRFQAFLEITAIACAGEQSAHIQRIDHGIVQNGRRFTVDNTLGETFRDGSFTNAGVTHQKRVVLATTAQNLNGALNFKLATDQRIDFAFARLLIEVHAIRVERLIGWLGGLFFFLTGWARRLRLGHARLFRNAMRDEVNRIIAGHFLLLQEVSRMAFTFREDRNKHVCAGHFIATRAFHVQDGTLDNALECSGRTNLIIELVNDEAGQIIIDIIRQVFLKLFQIHLTGGHHFNGFFVFRQSQKQVFQSGVFVMALGREGECLLECAFQAWGQ